MPPIALTGGSLVLRDAVVHADLHLQDGVIAAIGDNGHAPPDAIGVMPIDCSNCDILPGFVDLHTDNIERHVEPRAGMFQAPEQAVLAHDAELASAGVTTALDAITLGGGFAPGRRPELASRVIDAFARARDARALRIDHALHLRCELSDAALPATLEALGAVRPRIVSLMNHTPGQRQWRDLDKFHAYYARRYGLSRDEINALIVTRQQVGSSRVDLQACKLEYSIVSPK